MKSLVKCVLVTLILTSFCIADALADESTPKPLFPTDVTRRDWAQFPADGYARPVVGVVYRDGEIKPGMPLGGVGTGYVNIDSNGQIGRSTAYGSYVPPREIGTPFLGLSVDGKTTVLTTEKLKGATTADQIHYWGHFPIADLEYETKLPVQVATRAWTPFLPGDSTGSNVPGAVFEVRLHNPEKTAQSGTLVFSAPGPVESEAGPGAYERTNDDTNGVQGITVRKKWIPPHSPAGQVFTFGYTLGVVGDQPVRTGGGLKSDSAAWNVIEKQLPAPQVNDSSASVAVDFSLEPGESKTVRFIYAWYAPYMRVQQWDGSPKLHDISVRHYRHKYADEFSSSEEVASFLAKNHKQLLRRIQDWQQVLYDDEKLPLWLRESLVNIFHIIPRCGFWVTSTPRGSAATHWFGANGMFCMNESLIDCPQQNCIPCDWIGNHPIVMFFPDLARNTLHGLSHYQRRDGEIPFVFGHGTDMESPTHGNQAPIDGVEFVQLVDRLWQATGNDEVLKQFYDNVKGALEFTRTVDVDGDGNPNCQGKNHLYDAWDNYGNSIHSAGLWMASVKIAERMARHLGDKKFVEQCQNWYDKSSSSVEENLWNDATNSYNVYFEPGSGKQSDSILSDQVAGDWVSRYHDIDSVFRPERVEKVMNTLRRMNYTATPFGMLNCVQPDSTTDVTSHYTRDAITPSYSNMCPAMTMCYLDKDGLKDIGIEVVRRNWSNMVCRQDYAFNMPAVLAADNGIRYGADYYHNTMLWAMPAAVYGENLREFCAEGSLVDRVKKAAASTGD